LRALFLLDHDNIPHTRASIKKLIASWLNSLPAAVSSPVYIDIRAYGGWYDKDSATPARFSAADLYQRDCPTVLMHEGVLCRLSFRFADKLITPSAESLVDEMEHRITHTVALRGAPLYIQRQAEQRECIVADCELSRVRKWINKRKACPKPACPHQFDEYFVRYEQKQVDVHLSVDLLLACKAQIDHIVLVSEDWDLLPALLAASIECANGKKMLSLIRFRQSATYLDAILARRNVRIIHFHTIDAESNV